MRLPLSENASLRCPVAVISGPVLWYVEAEHARDLRISAYGVERKRKMKTPWRRERDSDVARILITRNLLDLINAQNATNSETGGLPHVIHTQDLIAFCSPPVFHPCIAHAEEVGVLDSLAKTLAVWYSSNGGAICRRHDRVVGVAIRPEVVNAEPVTEPGDG